MPAMPKRQSRLLIIDDDPVIGAIYRKKFVDAGFIVDIAEDATRGAAAILSFQPSIVLLDLNLGERSGLDLLRDLRSVAKFRDLPIVVITGEPEDSPMLAAASDSAVTGVLRKDEWSVDAVLSYDWSVGEVLIGCLDFFELFEELRPGPDVRLRQRIADLGRPDEYDHDLAGLLIGRVDGARVQHRVNGLVLLIPPGISSLYHHCSH